jgi:salicylate hydroxylase
MTGLSVAVIGGGIGGTSAALSVLQSGVDVHVYEQARELREVGAGMQISPNASRVLHRLGRVEALAEMGVKPLGWHQRRWQNGRTLLRTPLAEAMEAAFGSPHYQMHRADVLRTRVTALPSDRVHVGHRLASLADHGGRVEAQFENGVCINADVLVGADGIPSTVRRIFKSPARLTPPPTTIPAAASTGSFRSRPCPTSNWRPWRPGTVGSACLPSTAIWRGQ